ncbi:NYN domain-containing protein [Bacillus taeanensis]|uniref:NYN domain-containing protein n=1 Tax=Bacillus taeanensis TaxID=273032 RepID=A0A366XQE3_9BACI|nr:NYN domain-containing protein [Bacillus taeanensis]RBW67738.1 hypothetical protein DS031_20280 [Bacillus taeanensis]
MDVLLVDGYNIIGAWPELQRLKKEDLASARDLLIEKMAEYQAYTGYKVMVIFDAHMVPGIQATYKDYRVEVIYTKENETADELIERLAIELKGVRTQIHVATSDYAQQWAIFGQGALRKSARELLEEVKKVQKDISGKVSESNQKKRASKIPLSEEVAKIFENWRRGKGE